MIHRRNLLGHTAAAALGAGLAACSTGSASTPAKPVFLLVHGAWHGSWCWASVMDELSQQGYPCVAVDLPGHGIKAQFPAAYTSSPQGSLATEVSPLAALTTHDYRDYVLGVLRGLTDAGSGPVILVGHSLGGATITAVAEAAPTLVRKLVYLTAFCPINNPVLHYILSSEGATSLVPPLFQGDPAVVACARINHNSTDAAYQAQLKSAFFGDLSAEQFKAVGNLLTPDEPIGALATPVNPTAANWGRVPRAYIRCTQDNAIPIALQDKMIQEANTYSGAQPFQALTLNTSHSPFVSVPAAVASMLSGLA